MEEVEKSIERSLESSLLLSEREASSNQQDDSEEENSQFENLGIQSVEELFENIFSQMNVCIQNSKVFIENRTGGIVSLAIDSINFSTDKYSSKSTHRKDTKPSTIPPMSATNPAPKSKKLVEIENLNLQIIAPIEQQGNIFSLKNKNTIHLEYGKNEDNNLVDMQIEASFLDGTLFGILSHSQLHFLQQFIQTTANTDINNNNISTTKDTSPPTLPRSRSFTPLSNPSISTSPHLTTDPEQDPYLEALQRSILQMGPYDPYYSTLSSSSMLYSSTSSTSLPYNFTGASPYLQKPPQSQQPLTFTLRILIGHTHIAMHHDISSFMWDLHNLTIGFTRLEGEKKEIEFSIGNLYLSETITDSPINKKEGNILNIYII